MPVIDRSVVVAGRAPEVFDFLVRGESLPRWDCSVIACSQLDALPVTLGTRYRGVSRILGRRVEWTAQVIDFVAGERAEIKSIDGSPAFTVVFEVSAVPGGARVRYRLVVAAGLGGAFGRAIEPIIERAQTTVVQAKLGALARLLGRCAA